jgi:hypothetical protein
MFALPCQPQDVVFNSVSKVLAGCARLVDNWVPSGAEPRGYPHPLWTDALAAGVCASWGSTDQRRIRVKTGGLDVRRRPTLRESTRWGAAKPVLEAG